MTLSSAGSRSTRPGGSIASTAWLLGTFPEGASAALTAPSNPSTDLTVDADGLYVLLLTVTDDLGATTTCEVSLTAQAAASAADVLVQLTWDSADGDLDLHLNRATPPNWCVAADDCSYAARATSWGASLDIDDLNGFGPENLSLRGADDGTYTIGIGVFTASLVDVATVVKVFVGGELAFEEQQLMSGGDEWIPAELIVSGGVPSVRRVDLLVCEQASDCARCQAVNGAGNCTCSPFGFCSG